jgi:AcrR family transcriptional regulator
VLAGRTGTAAAPDDAAAGAAAAAGPDADDARRLLADAVDVYLRGIEADPHVYRFVVHRPLPAVAGGEEDPVAGLSALVGEHVAGLISVRLRAAGLPTDAAGPWGHGLVGLVRAAADHWLDSGARTDRERLRDQLTELAWGGLAGILGLAEPTGAHRPDRKPS